MEHQQQQQQSTTVPQTPPAIRRPVIRLSSSLSPPPTPNGYDTPNRQRQAAWWQSSVVRRSSSAVDEAVDELTEKSKFLLRKKSSCLSTPRMSSSTTGSSSEQDAALVEEEEEEDVPRIAGLDREEIMAGQLLGEGTFNCVYEVLGFDLQNPADDDTGVRRELVQASPTRFALKHLKPSLLDDTLQFEQAATDLVMEAKYMAALNHVNILKLHASPTQGTAAINSGFDGYFLLTDRLSETLAGRIDRWSQGHAQETNTVLCKLSYALQIAEALDYLHQQRIVFRDLKPSNIGFAQQDTNRIQLFDFGLCRELPPKSQARPYVHGAQPSELMDSSEYSLELDESWTEDDVQPQEEDDDDAMEQVYFMSGAGTQIYMAPEVLVQNRYNLKADVYSWAMTVTEMLLLEKPLEQYEMDDHIQYVCVEGDRPALEGHAEITESIRDLLAWAWEGDVSKRCTTQQLCQELPELIRQVEQEAPAAVGAACSGNWYSRLWQAAGRLQQYLVSVMGQALARVSSFLVGRSSSSRRSSNTSRDVTFDLPQDDKEEPDASATQEELEEEQDQSDQVLLSPRPTPRHSFSRSALLKRKPSSASTTAMTDDELDDDDLLGVSLSPSYSKPPMEALVERHNSNNSTNTTTTTGGS